MILASSLSSCITTPPSPMGDGALRQSGLVNVIRYSRGGEPVRQKPDVTVTDNGIAITYPRN